MGMAASQARYLELAARKTNVEYEGQQINQQRTALANESSGLFNKMLEMAVPTAPNYSEFQKTIYTFADGTNTYTIDSFARTTDDPSYNAKVNYYYTTTEYTGMYKERSDLDLHWETSSTGEILLYYGTKKLDSYNPQEDEAAVRQIYEDTYLNPENHTVMDPDTLQKSLVGKNYKDFLDGTITEAELKNKVWKYSSGGTTYYISADELTGNRTNVDSYKDGKQVRITPNKDAGITTYEVINGDTVLQTVKRAYQSTDGTDVSKVPASPSTKGITLTTVMSNTGTTISYTVPSTAITQDSHTTTTTEKTTQPVQNCYAKDLTNKQWQEEVKAYIERDDNGNYTRITLENYSNSFDLTVYQETDDKAYDEAMNNYVYEKAVYDKNIADINAKTEIIQQEDRTLELKLKQLDTEHNALQTEMDAVKKVCDKNVEETFKTFSG